MTQVLLIDNYDSFVHNLARYFEELGAGTVVVRSDAVTVDEVRDLSPRAIVLSPGPGTPRESGVCMDVACALGAEIPILGVCLGHQAIAAALGGRVVRAPEAVHGRTCEVIHDGRGVLAGLPSPLRGTRYHSLIVEEDSLPDELVVTARTPEGLVMGVKHRTRPIFGVQFHPESVLTQSGHLLLANFLRVAGIEPGGLPAGDFREPEGGADFYAMEVGEDLRPLPAQ